MHTAQDDLELNHQYCVSPSAAACTPGLLNHLAQRTPVALCMWELTPLMQALRIPSGWLYTITQLVTLLQYRYITPLSQILSPGSILNYTENTTRSTTKTREK